MKCSILRWRNATGQPVYTAALRFVKNMARGNLVLPFFFANYNDTVLLRSTAGYTYGSTSLMRFRSDSLENSRLHVARCGSRLVSSDTFQKKTLKGPRESRLHRADPRIVLDSSSFAFTVFSLRIIGSRVPTRIRFFVSVQSFCRFDIIRSNECSNPRR